MLNVETGDPETRYCRHDVDPGRHYKQIISNKADSKNRALDNTRTFI
jgi:hypothetical protein